MRADYFKHLWVGAMIGFALLPFIGFWSVVFVFFLSLAKEVLYDLWLGKGHFDKNDIAASVVLPILFWFCSMMCKC